VSKEFIEKRIGSASIAEAVRQQQQLAYFTEGKIQQPITEEYIKAFVDRRYSTDDVFLNWIKTIFGENNFLSFFKYLRNPVPSTKLVNDKIKPQLERVFHAEDSYFKYVIKGETVEEPDNLDCEEFGEEMLNALMYRHNDILVHDLDDINSPIRNLISIENVVAIESHKSVIKRLAYAAEIEIEDVTIKGYLYLDEFEYIFYDKDIKPIKVVPHDLGECPADYIAREAFSDDDVVRKSMFSYVGTDLEEFSFLKTIERMTSASGATPTIAKLKFSGGDDNKDVDEDEKRPNDPMSISSQQAKYQREVVGVSNEMQPGTIYDIDARLKDDGSVDTGAVQNHIKFFYMPVDAIKALEDKIATLQNEIIQSVTGDYKEQNESAQNEKQVSKGYITKEDSLRRLSKSLSRIRKRSDKKMLGLQYGVDRVEVEAFYGSDHFQESQNELYELLDKAKNPIERKEILTRINKNKYRFNPDKSKRQEILYNLMPYVSDVDFEQAVNTQTASRESISLYNRFPYWIAMFEAKYMDLVQLWETMENRTETERVMFINNSIKQLITAEMPQQIQTNNE